MDSRIWPVTCKHMIRQVLRDVFDQAGDNPPNVNQAWDRIKRHIRVSRSRVRDVLREAEFARRRRRPGRKAKPRPSQPTTGQENPPVV
jgi:hypothetical protein